MTAPDPSSPRTDEPAGAAAENGRERPAYDPARELRAAAGNLAEVGAYVQQYIGAKISGTLYGVRKLILLATLGAVVGIAGVSILITCAVLLVLGVSGMIAAMLPDWLDWLGPLLVGLLGVGLSSVVVFFMLRRAARIGKRMALEEYRTALHEQRRQFGHDAFTRSVTDAVEKDLEARTARAMTPEEREALREKRAEAQKARRQVEEDLSRVAEQ